MLPTTVSVSIIGLGWLGLPLARQLQAHGVTVRGSKREAEDVARLRAMGIDTVRCALTPELASAEQELHYLLDADWVVVNIPPGRRSMRPGEYLAKIQVLLDHQRRVKPDTRWLFVSSTSVYSNENRQLSEQDPASAISGSGEELARIEQQLLSSTAPRASVVRFGGLVGGARHPARYLAGKQTSGGEQPVNLIHLDDALGIIERVIERELTGEVFNACAPQHPTREQFYTAACQALGLSAPEFIAPELDSWKQVDSVKLGPLLDYRFQRPDPMVWLD